MIKQKKILGPILMWFHDLNFEQNVEPGQQVLGMLCLASTMKDMGGPWELVVTSRNLKISLMTVTTFSSLSVVGILQQIPCTTLYFIILMWFNLQRRKSSGTREGSCMVSQWEELWLFYFTKKTHLSGMVLFLLHQCARYKF